MLIDWKNPPTFARKKREGRDVEALGRLHLKRRKHKPSKAHATKAEISFAAKAKASASKAKIEKRNRRYAAFKDAVRAFWRGDRETFPTV